MNSWTAFRTGFRDGARPFLVAARHLFVSLLLVALLITTGVASVLVARENVGAIARAAMVLGEVLLLAGAAAGLFAALRVWWDLFLAAGFLPSRRPLGH